MKNKIIKQIYHIRSKPAQVWQALVNGKEIEKWSGGSAK